MSVKKPFYIYVFVRSRTPSRDVKKPDKIGLFGANIFFIRIGCPMCIKRFFSADLRQGLEPPKKANRFFAEYQ